MITLAIITVVTNLIVGLSIVALIINNRRQKNAELAQEIVADIVDSFDKQLNKFD